jgi:hypothetical protein
VRTRLTFQSIFRISLFTGGPREQIQWCRRDAAAHVLPADGPHRALHHLHGLYQRPGRQGLPDLRVHHHPTISRPPPAPRARVC